MRRYAGVLSSVLLVAASGCDKQIPAIDRSRIEPGSGWFCHAHPHGNDSLCSRTVASCNKLLAMFRDTNASGYAAETCEPQPSAWCFVRPANEPISWSCKKNLASCDGKRAVWNASWFDSGASECFEVK